MCLPVCQLAYTYAHSTRLSVSLENMRARYHCSLTLLADCGRTDRRAGGREGIFASIIGIRRPEWPNSAPLCVDTKADLVQSRPGRNLCLIETRTPAEEEGGWGHAEVNLSIKAHLMLN